MTFGKRIRMRRQELGISPELLSAKAEIAYGTLGRIERDQSDPRLSTILTLAELLRLDPAVLVAEAAEAQNGAVVQAQV